MDENLTAWEKMQRGRLGLSGKLWWGVEDDAPRKPDTSQFWFRCRAKRKEDALKWHLAMRFDNECIVAPCGHRDWDEFAEREASPLPQESCLNCLKLLARLPAGQFPDDRLLEKAKETPRLGVPSC